MKSLIVGAAALALIAGAALAGQAFESASSQPVKMATPPNLLSKSTMDMSQKSVDPAIFDPSHSTRYRDDVSNSQISQNPEKTTANEPSMPVQHVSNYRRMTTKVSGGN